MKLVFRILFALVLPAAASNAATDLAGTAPPAEIRIESERIPAGGTVQLKFGLTEPKPILTGTKAFGMGSLRVLGISVSSTAGDAFGVGQFSNGQLRLKAISPSATYGLVLDYPLFTVAAGLDPNAIPGSSTVIDLLPGSSLIGVRGQSLPFVTKPGTVTVGGSVFIHNVIPGGGMWPAGTVVRVLGGGFVPRTKLRTKFKTSSVAVISPREIRVTLGENVQMDSQPFDVTNPDNSSVTYYSYLRAAPLGASVHPAIASAEIAFPLVVGFGAVAVQHSAGINSSVLTALAMENPSAVAANLTLQVWIGAQLSAQTHLLLPAGAKVVRELGEFFGAKLAPGAALRVASTVPLRYVGFTADERTGDLTPFVVIRH